MLVKGIIQSAVENNQVKVRIPKYHKIQGTTGATNTDELPYAQICSPPGINPIYQPGDVVFIEFENSDPSYPVVMGRLYLNNQTSYSDINAQSMKTSRTTQLSTDTLIGDITYDTLTTVVKHEIL